MPKNCIKSILCGLIWRDSCVGNAEASRGAPFGLASYSFTFLDLFIRELPPCKGVARGAAIGAVGQWVQHFVAMRGLSRA